MDLYPHVDGTIWLRTCQKEIIDPIKCISSSGSLPMWINGKLFRNGPGASKVGDLEFGHLFDNFGLIHCFTITNGIATYQCRFVNSEYYKKIQSKRMLITDFGTKCVNDPCNTIFHRIKSIFNPSNTSSDNTMITIYPFADEMYAFGESSIIYRINKNNLQTEQKQCLFDRIGIVNHSAHPIIDSNGDIYNIGISFTKQGILKQNIVQFPINENSNEMFSKAHVVASLPVRKFLNPSYMHSFGMTTNFYLLVQQPLSISIPLFVKSKLMNDPLISTLKWDKKQQTRIDVISRKSGTLIKSFYTESLFFLHIINQYEIVNYIIIDICCYDDPSMINCMYTEGLKNMQSNINYAKLFRGRPKRFKLDMNNDKNTTIGEILCNIGCETPQINYKQHLGKYYKYFYAINSDVDCRYPGRIIKVDIEQGHTLTWCEENCYPSEPIFVPNENKNNQIDEDDGVLLASLVWGQGIINRVGLLVLNARNMKEIYRCVFETPSPVPKCLHGWYFPTGKINSLNGLNKTISLDNDKVIKNKRKKYN